jgi:hypothetical protein
MSELKGVVILKLKRYGRYLEFVAFTVIVSISLLYTSTSNKVGSVSTVEVKPSRIIIKSAEKDSMADNIDLTGREDTMVSVPGTNGTSEVQPLPVPDTNSQIIVTPLS